MSILNQLFEAVYYGADLEFKYNDNYYFINSGKIQSCNMDKHLIIAFESKNSMYEGDNESECLEIYSSIDDCATNNTNNLFEAKIFNGKTFYEIVNFITEINY